jgi:hypothetical protein
LKLAATDTPVVPSALDARTSAAGSSSGERGGALSSDGGGLRASGSLGSSLGGSRGDSAAGGDRSASESSAAYGGEESDHFQGFSFVDASILA